MVVLIIDVTVVDQNFIFCIIFLFVITVNKQGVTSDTSVLFQSLPRRQQG